MFYQAVGMSNVCGSEVQFLRTTERYLIFNLPSEIK